MAFVIRTERDVRAEGERGGGVFGVFSAFLIIHSYKPWPLIVGRVGRTESETSVFFFSA